MAQIHREGMQCLMVMLISANVVFAQQAPMAAPPQAPVAPGAGPMGKGPAIPGGALGIATELAVTGRLLLEDREAPAEPVQVDYECRGKALSVVTDAKGRFSIPVATRQVARSEVGTAVPDLNGCRVEVRVPGFEDLVVRLKHATKLSELDLGDLTLKSSGAQPMVIISGVSRRAPTKARNNYVKAMMAIGANKYDEALTALDKAVQAYPQYASALQLKGEVLEEMGRREEARECYRQAMAADAGYGKPLVRLAEMAADDQNPEGAARWAAMANHLAPEAFPKMYLIEGTAYFNLGRYDEAGKAALAGIRADRTDIVPGLHRLLGEVRFKQREYAAALEEFNRFVSEAPEAEDTGEVRARVQSCEKLIRAGGK